MRYKINDYVCLRGLQGVCKITGVNDEKYDLNVISSLGDDGGCVAHLWGIVEENLRDYKPEEIEDCKIRTNKSEDLITYCSIFTDAFNEGKLTSEQLKSYVSHELDDYINSIKISNK